ncbi:SHOCT domain-containing protein [Streptomyces sp. NPDC101194]|uniref:SHOCT domain-containing protein n=1 Tax=Streptomyces sp. NPDC101194 TaxID=3366127 RepID=UPI00380E8099
MMWYHSGWGGGWLLMIVIMVVFWSLLIVGAVALIHYLTNARRGHQAGPPPGEAAWGSRRAEDLLAERFARGEIDDDEYKRRLTLLREQR